MYGDLLVVGESGGFLIYTDGQNNTNNSNIISNAQNNPDFHLFQNYPNPFNSTTIINVYLEKDANINLTIYNMLGQKVNTLFNGYLEADQHSFTWNSIDENGNKAASGVYYYKISSENKFELAKKMLLIR
jgi:flagellar hook assembly protein FlgD